MVKDMIIAALLARVSMIYVFTEYDPVEAVWVFWMLAIVAFILILMAEDKVQRIRSKRREHHG